MLCVVPCSCRPGDQLRLVDFPRRTGIDRVVTGGNRPLKLTDSVRPTRGSLDAARTGVRLLFRFQGAEALARTSPGPRWLRFGVGALPGQNRFSGFRGGEKHYRGGPRASTLGRRNLDEVVRALALPEQQVAFVVERDGLEPLVRADGDAVRPHGALLQLAPGVALGVGEAGGGQHVDRVAEAGPRGRAPRHL